MHRDRSVCVVMALALASTTVLGQTIERFDVYGGYQRASVPEAHTMLQVQGNGWDFSAAYNMNSWLSGKADFSKVSLSTDFTGIASTFALYTYTFGPVFTWRKIPHVAPFAEFLVGAYHQTDNHPMLYVGSLAANGFAMSAGGGVDINLNKHIAVRPAEFDWLLLKVPLGGSGSSNSTGNYRYSAGIVARF